MTIGEFTPEQREALATNAAMVKAVALPAIARRVLTVGVVVAGVLFLTRRR